MILGRRFALFAVPVAALFVRNASAGSITLEDRIQAQRAIERVYWQHRLWPTDNPAPKPSIDAVMPPRDLASRVATYLKKSHALDEVWHRPITRQQLQAELDRMTRDTRDPKLLQELFDALGNDADLIAETLARQTLAERLVRNWHAGDDRGESFDAWWQQRAPAMSSDVAVVARGMTLAALPASACTNDTWSATRTEVPDARVYHYSVWTGTEMIVWGGRQLGPALQTGGRYDPATDTWSSMSLSANTPPMWEESSVVWTGTEMIVWGGRNFGQNLWFNTGARYNPTTDTWTPTSVGANVPGGRYRHTAVWTGTEMLIWGGLNGQFPGPTAVGRYDPGTDTWTTSPAGANTPSSRNGHSAVWTGTEMLVWGGTVIGPGTKTNTGGRYDPATNTWSATSTGTNVPAARSGHTGLWTGSELIVWGGESSSTLNTGGRYDPSTDSWLPTSTSAGVPATRTDYTAVWTGSTMIVWGGQTQGGEGAAYDPASDSWFALPLSGLGKRYSHSAVWTGTEMIVWGGRKSGGGLPAMNTGARYNPSTNSWVVTSTGATVPRQRAWHNGVWTGTEMIVWGGTWDSYTSPYPNLDTGGRYTPATDSWIPTSTGAGVPSPRVRPVALWTGSEMIVWGGSENTSPSTIMNSGSRYNPTTDTWVPISTGPGVPAGVTMLVGVWTGKEMIAFASGSPRVGLYDPVTDSWTPASMVNMPTYCMVALWTGSEVICWTPGSTGGALYHPITDTWTPMSAGGAGVGLDTGAVWTGAEMIVWGGTSGTSAGARYNPVTNTWTPTSTGANVPTPRTFGSFVWTGTEMIVWGGYHSAIYTEKNGRYDPASDTWQPISSFNGLPEREQACSVWTGSQMIVWGGDVPTNTGGIYCACPNGRLIYRDADGDGYGDGGVSRPSCDGTVPVGFTTDALDCDDAHGSAHPGAAEICDGLDNDCDELVDELASAEDADGDGIHDLCDDCRMRFDPAQTDFDHDGEGDACDLDDGEIFVYGTDDKTRIEWQAESGPSAWNVYEGDLEVLRSTGSYTQEKTCGVIDASAEDLVIPSTGAVRFSLVTGVTGGTEGSLGTNHAGSERANTNPCP